MQRFRCNTHSVIISIPNNDREFHIGKYHQDIEYCLNHIKEFPNCKFEEIVGEY